jgi:hypothetical protein
MLIYSVNRTHATLKDTSIEKTSYGAVVRHGDIVPGHPTPTVEHIVRDIHDILKRYYELARKRFVDNVWMQATNHHLITGPDSPPSSFLYPLSLA